LDRVCQQTSTALARIVARRGLGRSAALVCVNRYGMSAPMNGPTRAPLNRMPLPEWETMDNLTYVIVPA
jgi:hypothetical protein